MKPLKLLLAAFAVAVFGAAPVAGTEPAFKDRGAAHATPHPTLYSFADVFRLTVSGPLGLPGMEAPAEAPIRVAAPQSHAAPEPRFSIAGPRQPDKWLLILAGLALAGWVAHRRLVHSI